MFAIFFTFIKPNYEYLLKQNLKNTYFLYCCFKKNFIVPTQSIPMFVYHILWKGKKQT